MTGRPNTSPRRQEDTRAKGSDADGKHIPFEVGCERCRKGKKKCNRLLPCQTCESNGVDCVYPVTEKKRPVPKEYVNALERDLEARNVKIEALKKQVQDLSGQVDALKGMVTWWEGATLSQVASRGLTEDRGADVARAVGFVRGVAEADAADRNIMLSGLRGSGENTPSAPFSAPVSPTAAAAAHTTPPPAQPQTPRHGSPSAVTKTTGQIRTRGALSRFYGPTSYQIATATLDPGPLPPTERRSHRAIANGDGEYDYARSLLAPQSADCRKLMSLFFLRLYPYHMYFYREFFLRDLHSGGGPYYSDLLMYAICSMAALVSKDPAERQRSELFARRAQELLYDSGMDSPDITVLQALLLMSQREIGQGHGSKGWLFAGMAFRLAHDMGLHLDPRNWDSSEESSIEREIRRRCYWGAFVADKWISLYFGRPPALSPRESDVRETKRIQYPECWLATSSILEPALIKDLFSGKKTPQDEDGAALVGTLLCSIDLTKIVHKMLTNVFEIRDQKPDEASLGATVTEIHLELTSWLSNLPKKVHWNEWRNDVEPYTLVLHMMYHTALIVLHRPPLTLQYTRTPVATADFDICWASVTAIIKLIKQYVRGNEYLYLPMTFIHTATAAASIILLKRHTVQEDTDEEASKFLHVILDALDGCSATWSTATQAKQTILMADEEARLKVAEFQIKTEGGDDINAIGLDLEQYFGLEYDSVMGGMGMGVGGVVGWMDPDWWMDVAPQGGEDISML